MAMCSNGCPRPTWDRKPNGYCSRSCRDGLLCKRRECTNLTWNRKPGEYCSKSCRDGRPQRDSMHLVLTPSTPIQGQYGDLIGFYFPGKESPVDLLCNASFLGNFYPGNPFFMVIQGRSVSFNNAEAAYQSTKYNVGLDIFSSCQTGSEAFKYKQFLDAQGLGVFDPNFNGFGSKWTAMRQVLEAKFADSTMAGMLCQTDDAFLLEHCDRPGRDCIWSNNNDGEGTNWLGLLLMYLRNSLLARHPMHGLENLGLDQNQGPTHTNHRWMQLVRHHSAVVRRALQ